MPSNLHNEFFISLNTSVGHSLTSFFHPSLIFMGDFGTTQQL
jgi:hypothetical protein